VLVTFLGTSSPGAMQQEVVTAKPGMYVLACFMTTQDGREHKRLGAAATTVWGAGRRARKAARSGWRSS
jgi:hypothetical protein